MKVGEWYRAELVTVLALIEVKRLDKENVYVDILYGRKNLCFSRVGEYVRSWKRIRDPREVAAEQAASLKPGQRVNYMLGEGREAKFSEIGRVSSLVMSEAGRVSKVILKDERTQNLIEVEPVYVFCDG